MSRRGCISPSGRRLPIIPFFVRSNLIHDRGAGEESTNEKDVNREVDGVDALVGAEPTNTLQETYKRALYVSSFSQLTFYPSRHTKQPRQVSRNGTLVDTCFTETVVMSLGFPL